jgi:hypothetical protein
MDVGHVSAHVKLLISLVDSTTTQLDGLGCASGSAARSNLKSVSVTAVVEAVEHRAVCSCLDISVERVSIRVAFPSTPVRAIASQHSRHSYGLGGVARGVLGSISGAAVVEVVEYCATGSYLITDGGRAGVHTTPPTSLVGGIAT